MDNSAGSAANVDNLRKTWGPKPGLLWIGLAAAVALGVAAWFFAAKADRPGALLLAIGAIVATAATAYGAVVRTRLIASPEGIETRTLTGAKRASWHDVQISVHSTRRLGRDVKMLELEFGEHLVVYGWLDLGDHPDDVRDELQRIRAGS